MILLAAAYSMFCLQILTRQCGGRASGRDALVTVAAMAKWRGGSKLARVWRRRAGSCSSWT